MKKNDFLIVILSIFIVSVTNGQDWKTIKAFVQPQTITTIYAGEDEAIFAVSALYDGTDLNIKRSDDNGETWVEQKTGFTQMNFRGLASTGNNDVFAIGNAGALITNNGTETWSAIDLGTSDNLRSIYFVNDKIGYLGLDRGIVFKTEDGGQTWFDLKANVEGVGSVSNLYFINEEKGFMAGFNYMQVTYDGGVNWNYVQGYSPRPGELFQIQEIDFVNEDVGYLCGDVGLMAKTMDGGDTWAVQNTGTTESLQDLKFINENVGFACGFEATIIYTLDGGQTWMPMTSDDTEHFRSIDVNSQRGFISTQRSKILALDGIPDIVSVLDYSEIEVSVFPNPTADMIRYSTSKMITHAILFDQFGTQLQVWNLSARNGDLDISPFNVGVYHLGLFTSNGEGRLVKIIRN